MAKFLTTAATSYHLEELIKAATERLIIISPFLQFNPRIKELLAEKNQRKIHIRLVYGKSELAPQEINWLQSQEEIRTYFCQNLHAKCYLSENAAIITSMNLYEFSQANNHEMGVLIAREDDPELYKDTHDEAQRIIQISDSVRLSAEKVVETDKQNDKVSATPEYAKLTSSKLAKALGMKTAELTDRLLDKGFLMEDGDQLKLTDAGKKAGGESKFSNKYGSYLLWPKDMKI